MGTACPNFVEKIFAGGSKTVKFVNVFYLEIRYRMLVVNLINQHLFNIDKTFCSWCITVGILGKFN